MWLHRQADDPISMPQAWVKSPNGAWSHPAIRRDLPKGRPSCRAEAVPNPKLKQVAYWMPWRRQNAGHAFSEDLPKRSSAMDVVRREHAIRAQVRIRRLELPGHVIPGVQAVVVNRSSPDGPATREARGDCHRWSASSGAAAPRERKIVRWFAWVATELYAM